MITLTLDNTFVGAVVLVLAAMKASDMVYDAAMKWRAEKDAQKKFRTVSHDEYRRTVIHEAGHALLVHKLFPGTLESITCWKRVAPNADHLGLVTHDTRTMSHEDYFNDMTICFGGYVAECLMLGSGDLGAWNDLTQALNLAMQIASTRAHDGKAPIPWQQLLSVAPTPEANERFQAEVVDLMHRAHEKAVTILTDCRPEIEKIIVAFETTEQLSKRELDDLLGVP